RLARPALLSPARPPEPPMVEPPRSPEPRRSCPHEFDVHWSHPPGKASATIPLGRAAGREAARSRPPALAQLDEDLHAHALRRAEVVQRRPPAPDHDALDP